MNARTTESLLARRGLAEKAMPGPWGQVIAGLERVAIDSKGTVVCTVCLDEDFRDKETERQVLANLYHIAVNSPAIVIADIDEILRLREEVKRLEKEADWLAERASATDCLMNDTVENCTKKNFPCVACFREAARKAVEENNEDKN